MKKHISKLWNGFKYTGYILARPVRGFYEMRFENQGNLLSCMVLLLLMTAVLVCRQVYAGFLFNNTDLSRYNLFRQIANILLPVFLWCVANWSITALTNGEGRFRDVFMTVCYASAPLTIATLLYIPLSWWLSAEESGFLGILMGAGILFSVMMLFVGTVTIHQFTVIKTLFTILLTLFGMMFLVFLMVLFASVFDALVSYIGGIVTEIELRM